MFRRIVLFVAIAATVGACGGGSSKRTTGATVPATEATTVTSITATTAPASDPSYAVPADATAIDAAYVDRVLAALNHVYGDIARRRLTSGQFVQSDLVPLRAIYNDPAFGQQAEALAKTESPPASELRSPMGDRKMTTKQILAAEPDCIALVVSYDFSEIRTNPPPVKDWYVTLEPHDPNTDPQHLNPTPWSFGYDGDTQVSRCS